MKVKFLLNSLIAKILCTILIGVLCLSIIISTATINISKRNFIEVYSNSQQHVFDQIYDDLYDFHGSIVKVINLLESNWAYKSYFQDDEASQEKPYRTTYYVQKNLKDTLSNELNDINVMILGLNQKSYINVADKLIIDKSEILNNEITKKTIKDNDLILYQYKDSGFTAATQNTPVVMITKAIKDSKTNEVFAVLYITIKESDFEKYYKYFTSEVNDIYVINDFKEVISSNCKDQLGEKEINYALSKDEESIKSSVIKTGSNETLISRNLQYSNLKIYGVIDNNKALGKMYDKRKILFISAIITVMVLVIILIYISELTKPLSKLVNKMSSVRNGNFNEYVKVEGTEEIKELSRTYNYMLEDLNQYVEKLVHVQNEKRKAEIHALQMQINPHYVFNTLASIKWLIWQGDEEKSVKIIDAFILLLRNTISNKNEFITIREEITNVKNYVLINNTRYGERINVEYFILNKCEDYLVPKLILQPFIENAFFHGFPGERKGTIQVFIHEKDENVIVEIIDDGVGMDEERVSNILAKDNSKVKTEHFTGIGVNNVDDRIKLIYGKQYGISIKSSINEGTKVKIVMPIKKE